MPRLNNDEQFKFLISCIRYSNNGKVTYRRSKLTHPMAKHSRWISLRLPKNVISYPREPREPSYKEPHHHANSPRAKRYERMMKAHGIHQGRESYASHYSSMMRPSEDSETTAPAGKKRKHNQCKSPSEHSSLPPAHEDQAKQDTSLQKTSTDTVKAEPDAQSVTTTVASRDPVPVGYPLLAQFDGYDNQSYGDVDGELDLNRLLDQTLFDQANESYGYLSNQAGFGPTKGGGSLHEPFPGKPSSKKRVHQVDFTNAKVEMMGE